MHSADVLRACRDHGFALAGVSDAAPTRFREQLIAWLNDGRHGTMAYLAEHLDVRVDPAVMVPDAKSIICVADRYHDGSADPSHGASPPRGRIARYARGEDYHAVMKKRLHRLCDALQHAHPHERFRACVDTAPVLEREYAQRAGIGAVGKNTLLIQPGVGSYLLLGEIITTLALEPSVSLADENPCGSCTRCIDACPTEAITPFSVDAQRCISYLTIEHRQVIDEQFHTAMGEWIFGCDICQEVCPHNQPTQRSLQATVHEAYAPRRDGFDLLAVLNWSEDDRRAAFTRSSMKRAKLDMMKRNALIAAGNAIQKPSGPQEQAMALLRRIEDIACDAEETGLVRQTARQVLGRITAADTDTAAREP